MARIKVMAVCTLLLAVGACSGGSVAPTVAADASRTGRFVLAGDAAGITFNPTEADQVPSSLGRQAADQATVPRECNDMLVVEGERAIAVGHGRDALVITMLIDSPTAAARLDARVNSCPELALYRFGALRNTQTVLPRDASIPQTRAFSIDASLRSTLPQVAPRTSSIGTFGVVDGITVVTLVASTTGGVPDASLADDVFRAQADRIVHRR